MQERKQTKIVNINNLKIGGKMPILIQSMTNTKTKDVASTVNQINDLVKLGCHIVRVAVLDKDDAKAIKEIKAHVTCPIVADIHFDYHLALLAIESGVDKLRINPGNIGDIEGVKQIVKQCSSLNIPIRIGVNGGSLDKKLLAKYDGKVTASALVESAECHVKILEDLGFYNIVISLKSSDIHTMIDAYRLASKRFDYPLHLGLTEAGSEYAGTIKSAVALGTLLNEGIGDTIRVSLCGDPRQEVIAAKEILSSIGLYNKPQLVACPTCGRTEYDMVPIVKEIEKYLENFPSSSFKVAIMGCIVNGPGEARDADIGIAGGKNCAVLFKKGEIIKKISENERIEELKKEILLLAKSPLSIK